ncbi:MAG: glucose-6-phosphate isomerase, glucose-6-phosphate isomerase [Candidatus Peregrinibacteria bacterium GW2011_GWF2_33_10]|nr:MAG: glucose-6-phosphate isomerase, glucose-6-phosphate isomerase [Candidatus Peregrinibacteria bacterium GW2011_GWF2_33_10]OGJ44036.1 MAG: hypothetical protein A2272_01310 [Candidatus Peregrinibacteria bacterium RIFOXYA12_FULL_33_12]OGJ44166.1 MAG: hypothetical protein A2263_04280 [Candidatus Peregrinibacteria bacterium RIFOXYA2_FULL_33_21]OGJ51795.1 MAG: hypothetical protein A2307_04945 [Candidatus Peregrinibacteria bacterium RIFOXYB2_FULL_33_20]
MFKLNTQHLFQISSEHGISKKEFESKANLIKPYLQKIHAQKQGFYSVIDDKNVVKSINDFAKNLKGQFDDIVVLGIGGSALGTICLQQSLKNLFENCHSCESRNLKSSNSKIPASAGMTEKEKNPNLHIIDNIDPELISELDQILDYKKTLFIVVTKSGSTPETLAQYFYFRQKCDNQKLNPKKHFVFITDPKLGLLRKIANEEKIPIFDVPENVGGRFSVLTAVGLLPAKLIGINIEKLLKGAQKMRDLFLSENFAKNLSFQIATIQYLLSKKQKTITVMMPYAQKLIKFSDWYRQLLAESIGKAQDNNGKTINVGLTPINSLGVTDQHSQSQLYMEGPNDKFFIFIKVLNHGQKIPIPYAPELEYLKNVDFQKLLHTEMQGAMQALTKNNRPNILIEINKIEEENLGELFMLFEGSIAFLGEFFNINAFDQPGVELSKILTKKLLGQKSSNRLSLRYSLL